MPHRPSKETAQGTYYAVFHAKWACNSLFYSLRAHLTSLELPAKVLLELFRKAFTKFFISPTNSFCCSRILKLEQYVFASQKFIFRFQPEEKFQIFCLLNISMLIFSIAKLLQKPCPIGTQVQEGKLLNHNFSH